MVAEYPISRDGATVLDVVITRINLSSKVDFLASNDDVIRQFSWTVETSLEMHAMTNKRSQIRGRVQLAGRVLAPFDQNETGEDYKEELSASTSKITIRPDRHYSYTSLR